MRCEGLQGTALALGANAVGATGTNNVLEFAGPSGPGKVVLSLRGEARVTNNTIRIAAEGFAGGVSLELAQMTFANNLIVSSTNNGWCLLNLLDALPQPAQLQRNVLVDCGTYLDDSVVVADPLVGVAQCDGALGRPAVPTVRCGCRSGLDPMADCDSIGAYEVDLP